MVTPSEPRLGRVVLVGAGPGDPELITVKGARALAEADVVVVDRLAGQALLDGLTAEIIDVGKKPLHHPVPQPEIRALLVERALAGQLVVRLKGGDPFLLGRGGEEVLACRAAGVPVEVIPGVTSALAGPAVADIPVTQRSMSKSVTIVSGHDSLDYPALAALDGTLVVLMGMSRLHEVAAGLIRAGCELTDPGGRGAPGLESTPGRGARRPRPDRHRLRRARVGAPSVIVIGRVAAGLDALADPDALVDPPASTGGTTLQ